ncbi:MAG: cupin domain-containing protein [Halobacteriales archaeon]|nr:cupin domain-containing protein [Halobacteriales archaeon]
MRQVALDAGDHPPTISPADVLRPVGWALGTTDVGINSYERAPGAPFGFDDHRHLDQEEVFYVRAGTVTFLTEAGDVEVGPGELVRFAPGEFQPGRKDGPDRVVAVAIGAPAETTEIEYRRSCPPCDVETVQSLTVDREATVVTIACTACGSMVDRIGYGG